jgi:hypothetical protein
MAVKMRLEFNSAGFREILCSQNCADIVDKAGERIADEASAAVPYLNSEGYNYHPARLSYGGGRAGGYIHGADYLAHKAEAQYKTLTKAVHG